MKRPRWTERAVFTDSPISLPPHWPVASLVLVIQLSCNSDLRPILPTDLGPVQSTVVVLLYMYVQAFLQAVRLRGRHWHDACP